VRPEIGEEDPGEVEARPEGDDPRRICSSRPLSATPPAAQIRRKIGRRTITTPERTATISSRRGHVERSHIRHRRPPDQGREGGERDDRGDDAQRDPQAREEPGQPTEQPEERRDGQQWRDQRREPRPLGVSVTSAICTPRRRSSSPLGGLNVAASKRRTRSPSGSASRLNRNV
jgi:hypothetical protein